MRGAARSELHLGWFLRFGVPCYPSPPEFPARVPRVALSPASKPTGARTAATIQVPFETQWEPAPRAETRPTSTSTIFAYPVKPSIAACLDQGPVCRLQVYLDANRMEFGQEIRIVKAQRRVAGLGGWSSPVLRTEGAGLSGKQLENPA